MRKKTKEYQTLVLKDIFPEEKLKKYMGRIKNILQKMVKMKRLVKTSQKMEIVSFTQIGKICIIF